jgi:hypothetical protein
MNTSVAGSLLDSTPTADGPRRPIWKDLWEDQMVGAPSIRGHPYSRQRSSGWRHRLMYCKIVTREAGTLRTYVGHVISWGPDTIHLLITEPYPEAGHLVVLELAQVVSEEKLAA